MAKKNKRQRLIKNLDDAFSLYIRLRDRVSEDYAKCITCGAVNIWKGENKVDCGHFQVRQHMGTRWNEKNCAAQCVTCNKYNQGRQYEFGLALDSKFGKGTADKMLVFSRKVTKYGIYDLEEMIKYYENKIKKELQKRKTSVTLPKKYLNT